MRTLMIGEALSGFALTEALAAKGHDFALITARGRLGGRRLTEHNARAAFNLGPAWF
jgi:monoamine oxidase